MSSITTQFLEWSLEKLEESGKKVLVLIWDNASWHTSREVRRWLGKHYRRVKQSGEGEDCELPFAQAESMAQRHRAQMGSWQEESG